ncbi:MAG: metal ABC transporter permease [Saprospiraceae bacterium]|nr:metal ABC transporter permease [Saprospiraceae bacterium]
MVGIMCGILGCFIVLRNMALIGDALAHAVLPGIVVAFVVVGYSAMGFFIGSVVAGLVTAVAITWIQQQVNTKNDAAIGIVFTAMFALGVIGISWISKNQGVHLDLKDFLFGNVLGVSDQDLYMTFFVTLVVIASVVVFYRQLFLSTFQPVISDAMGFSTRLIHYLVMLLLSFAVVASLRTVGVILVVAMLITPASTALLLSQRLKNVIFLAGLIGFLAAFLGLVFAILLETAPGPAMTVVATILYLLAALFSPTRGIVLNYFRRRKLQRRIRLEDVLKQTIRLDEVGKVSVAQLNARLEISKGKLRQLLRILEQRKLLNLFDEKEISLTEKGIALANKLVRAHRLWETYLVDQVGLSQEQIHNEAEKYEHFLTEEILDEVDAELGYPRRDPHGSPIPLKDAMLKHVLAQMHVSDQLEIAADQTSSSVSSALWKLGLLPGSILTITGKNNTSIRISAGDAQHDIAYALAQKIHVHPV